MTKETPCPGWTKEQIDHAEKTIKDFHDGKIKVIDNNDKETTHLKVMKYEGEYTGIGIEYPGINVSAKTKKDLKKEFEKALTAYKIFMKASNIKKGEFKKETIPTYKKIMKHFNIKEKDTSIISVSC